MKAVFVDSDVFVRDLRYPRDQKTAANKKFLDKMGRDFSAVTSIFNLLEICGILSFQLNEQELIDLYRDFAVALIFLEQQRTRQIHLYQVLW